MLKMLTATALVAIATSPLAYAGTKTVDAGDFTQIEAKAAMNVIYTAGPERSVQIETDGDDFSDADVSVDGDTLVITRVSAGKRSWLGGGANMRVSDDGKTIRVNGKKVPYYTVRVTSPDLKGIKMAQSATGEASGIKATNFTAQASSSAELKLSGSATRAEINASSSGEIDASQFAAGSLDINASSSGEIEAMAAGTEQTDVSASSSGGVSLRSVEAASFKVNASSGAEIELSGLCNSVDISASSGADVNAGDLKCQTATANASSGGDIEAFASGSAIGSASSGGDVSFEGAPKETDSKESSGGSVSFN